MLCTKTNTAGELVTGSYTNTAGMLVTGLYTNTAGVLVTEFYTDSPHVMEAYTTTAGMLVTGLYTNTAGVLVTEFCTDSPQCPRHTCAAMHFVSIRMPATLTTSAIQQHAPTRHMTCFHLIGGQNVNFTSRHACRHLCACLPNPNSRVSIYFKPQILKP